MHRSDSFARYALGFTVLAVIAHLSIRPAEACSDSVELGHAGLGVLPPTGTTAPRNSWIWVAEPEQVYGEPAVQASDVVITSAMGVIPTTARSIVTRGEIESPLWLFDPSNPLPAGATIEVRVRGTLVSSFVVSTAEDTTAPAQPTITRVDASGAYFGLWFCGEASRVTVSTGPTQDILFLTREPPDALTFPDAILAIATGDQVTAVDLESGEQALYVAAVDLAGNVSAASTLPPTVIPAKVQGCAAGSGNGGAWSAVWILIAITWHRRRCRSRRHLASGLRFHTPTAIGR